MAKFKIGDIVTGTDLMHKYESHKGIFIVINPEGPTNYGEPTIIVKVITPMAFFEPLQYERHFQLVSKTAKLLWGK